VSSGIRINELVLVGAVASAQRYGASFRTQPGQGFRPLSVIAGPASTGKTTIVDFIRYCLGDDRLPQHPEVIAAVRAAFLEAELDGNVTTIERATGGSPSKFASVWEKALGDAAPTDERRISAEPPSNPDGLSQFVLAACDLNGIELPEAPTQAESPTQMLSIRDLFRIMFVPNERLDNRNLVYEQSHHMVRQKFHQTIDVMFNVHDNQDAVLSQRYIAAQQAVRAARQAADMLRNVVEDDHPQGPLALETELAMATATIESLQAQLAELDAQQRSTETASTAARNAHAAAQQRAIDARVRLRDRRSLLLRLHALRAQYADDKRKLIFLKDAERLFDPLQVVVCPSCLSRLVKTPAIVDGQCTLCHSQLALGATPTDGDKNETADATSQGGAVIEGELRALTRRMDGLNDYVDRLESHARLLENESLDADSQADDAALALDNIVTSPAPWLALRDSLTRRLADARLAAQVATAGVNAWARVADADSNRERLAAEAERISAQRKAVRTGATRNAVVNALSQRFGSILSEIGYPKLQNPYLNQGLVPYVRNQPYSEASSGGMVLISLAWNLALWEVAHEHDATAPGGSPAIPVGG
jgi:hypothetical protein